MGSVYEALQRSIRKRVALKLLKQEGSPRPMAIARFFREARAVAQLRHSNLVDIHGIGRTPEGGYFLVMDLIEGEDLEVRIGSGRLTAEDASSTRRM